MREERNLLQVLVILLQLELRAYNRITAARIDDVTRGDFFRDAILWDDAQPHFAVGESDVFDRSLLAHFRAAFRGVIEQEFVELRPRHLIGAVRPRAKAILEIKFHALFAARSVHLAAKFFHETGAGEFLMQTEPGESLHAERQK